jgi:hypothetical protein
MLVMLFETEMSREIESPETANRNRWKKEMMFGFLRIRYVSNSQEVED